MVGRGHQTLPDMTGGLGKRASSAASASSGAVAACWVLSQVFLISTWPP
jgi:hypothetical protein